MKGGILRSLLRLAFGGDPEAFDQVVAGTRESLFWTVRRMTGRDAIADEVLQEAYLALWERGRAGLPEEPEAWLRRFCVNRAIDHLRREETRRVLPEPDVLDACSVAPKAEQTLWTREVEDALAAALEVLPAHERAVFLLRFVEGLDFRAIASSLGVAESTVRNQAMQARRKVQRRLEERGISL